MRKIKELEKIVCELKQQIKKHAEVIAILGAGSEYVEIKCKFHAFAVPDWVYCARYIYGGNLYEVNFPLSFSGDGDIIFNNREISIIYDKKNGSYYILNKFAQRIAKYNKDLNVEYIKIIKQHNKKERV